MASKKRDVGAASRRGRRPGDSGTRQAVLEAARALFASEGFAATTIRKVASTAGVDAALVMQFFGTKEGLFAAVLAVPPEALARIAEAFDGAELGLGERVTRAFLELWEGPPADSQPLVAMVRASVSTEQAGAQLRDFVQTRLVEVIGPKLRPRPDAAQRAGFASSMLVGVIIGRCIVRLPVLADAEREAVVKLVGPAIQAVLTAASPAGGAMGTVK